MRSFLQSLFLLFFLLLISSSVYAVPITCDFSDWSSAPTSTGQVDVDTTDANDWFYDNYGITFNGAYMYYDSRDAFDNIGLANDTPGMNGYDGGVGTVFFADTTDFVTVDWTTINTNDIYINIYDTGDNLIDTFFQSGSGTISGTTTLAGDNIAYMTFHDNGGAVGISTLSYDFDGNTDGHNDDTAPVPEPATLFLLGSGILGLFGYRKKSGKSTS